MRTIFLAAFLLIVATLTGQTAKDTADLKILLTGCEKSPARYTLADGTRCPVYLSADKETVFVVMWDRNRNRWNLYDPYSGWNLLSANK